MIKLTKRQQEILALIQSHMAQHSSPPTRAEIARIMGFKSPNAAEDHLRALARKGVIELVSGTSRGIRLADQFIGLPVVRLDQINQNAILSPHLFQQNLKLDKNFFKTSTDVFVQLHRDFPEFHFLNGDKLAIHLTDKIHTQHVLLVRHHQELRLCQVKEPNDLVEGWVIGMLRNLDT